MPIRLLLAENLGRTMDARRISASHLSACARCSRGFLQDVLAARHPVGIDLLGRFAFVLETCANELLLAHDDVGPPLTCRLAEVPEPLRRWLAENVRRAGFTSPTELALACGWHRSTASALLNGQRS